MVRAGDFPSAFANTAGGLLRILKASTRKIITAGQLYGAIRKGVPPATPCAGSVIMMSLCSSCFRHPGTSGHGERSGGSHAIPTVRFTIAVSGKGKGAPLRQSDQYLCFSALKPPPVQVGWLGEREATHMGHAGGGGGRLLPHTTRAGASSRTLLVQASLGGGASSTLGGGREGWWRGRGV